MSRAWEGAETEEWRARLEGEGIRWLRLGYHKRPSLPATAYDVVAGAILCSREVTRDRIKVLHGRGHVGAAVAVLAKWLTGASVIFDIRGFFPEEYVDAGLWSSRGIRYRVAKFAERWLFKFANGFVVLTERARDILFPGCSDEDAQGRPIAVIPCCVDLDRFGVADRESREQAKHSLGLGGRRVFVYVGALGGWHLSDEMADFLALAHREDPLAFSMVLTQSDPSTLVKRLNEQGVDSSRYLARRVEPDEVPRYLSAADLALSFVKPCYSKQSSSPTKIAEYLASGLPVISSAGIGDLDEVIEGDRVGVQVRRFDEESYRAALRSAELLLSDPGVRDRCRECARRRFDLQTVGGPRYRRLYRRVTEQQAVETA
jgi:glycosyltransferase involved in cell wall biosynthesis